MTVLSIVTGTYNRLPYLRHMMEGARAQIPRHVAHEFVIVDGGSADGTIEWLRAQSDTRLIQHGELRGAIKAFCEGARAATGDYVIMANDDIEFKPYAIPRAIRHLESMPTCGAVAFADNRSAQRHQAAGPRVEKMPAIAADGRPTALPYAQVGMFRRWIGDRCGWWGDTDEYMRNSRTYGGDNFLSARIWEMGYSVDPVTGCEIEDLIVDDALRAHSRVVVQNDSAQYYARYPRGPYAKAIPEFPNPQRERLRIVLMDIHEPRLPARKALEYGLADALAKCGLLWHIDYVNEPFDLPQIVTAWRPHLLITQMHDTSRINAAMLRAAREQNPSMVIVNWNGDAHERGLIAPDILEALHEVDLQTIVNTAVMPIYAREGIRAAYWQIAYKNPAKPYAGPVPAHDVLWQGNCYDDRRVKMVDMLRTSFDGLDVGLYGSCAGTLGSTHYDFAQQAALYGAAKITVGDTYPGTIGFVSNRLFQALAAGAFLLQEYSEQLDELTGLRANEHYVPWFSLEDLKNKVMYFAAPEQAQLRATIAACGKAFVRENFSYDAQVAKLWSLLP